MKAQNSRNHIFIQRLMIVISLILTLEFLDKTESHIQLSMTQNFNWNMNREHLVSLGLYFTSFGIITPLGLLALKHKKSQ
ncbi:MAG: hypothetical protein WBA13_07835 [Microcoleaceae cyanobacterium]